MLRLKHSDHIGYLLDPNQFIGSKFYLCFSRCKCSRWGLRICKFLTILTLESVVWYDTICPAYDLNLDHLATSWCLYIDKWRTSHTWSVSNTWTYLSQGLKCHNHYRYRYQPIVYDIGSWQYWTHHIGNIKNISIIGDIDTNIIGYYIVFDFS